MILVVHLSHGIFFHPGSKAGFSFYPNQFFGSRRTCLKLPKRGTSEKKWCTSIVAWAKKSREAGGVRLTVLLELQHQLHNNCNPRTAAPTCKPHDHGSRLRAYGRRRLMQRNDYMTLFLHVPNAISGIRSGRHQGKRLTD